MVLRRAASVVCVTERHTTLLRQTFSELPFEKFVTIPNGYDEAEWDGLESGSGEAGPGRKDKFVITYAGSLYTVRHMVSRTPQPLFHALRVLVDAGDIVQDRIQVDLIGDCEVAEGRPVADMAGEYGLNGCVHVGKPLARPEILRRLAESDLLLLLGEGLTLQIPSKTYEYLRAGRPILALTLEGALADLLRRVGGGWVVDPADKTGIAAAVREAYRAWKDGLGLPAADRAGVSSFDRRVLTGRLAGLFERAIAGVHA